LLVLVTITTPHRDIAAALRTPANIVGVHATQRARGVTIRITPKMVRRMSRTVHMGIGQRKINSLIDLRSVLERLGNRGYLAAELLSANRRRSRLALHPCCPRSSPGSSLWDYLVRTLCFAVLCHTEIASLQKLGITRLA